MPTIAEVQHALRLLPLDERQVIAAWLEGYQEEETGLIGVAEPAAVYAVDLPYMSVEEYLKFEERSATRHEYVNGFVHAMCGASMAHNRIVTRLYKALEKRLRGGPCEIFLQDLKLEVKNEWDDLYYYPDVMVSCDSTGWKEKWIVNPRLVIEVLSPSTQHIDWREKATTYRRLPSVEEYVIAAQSSWHLTIHRRSENWVPERVKGPEGVAELRSLGVSIPLSEVYRGVFADPASSYRADPESYRTDPE
jgi:Uma2 family endonuclease